MDTLFIMLHKVQPCYRLTPPDFLNLAEAAEYIGVSKDTHRRWDA